MEYISISRINAPFGQTYLRCGGVNGCSSRCIRLIVNVIRIKGCCIQPTGHGGPFLMVAS